MPERLQFIDAAKAIGISLVVLGHSPGLPGKALILIYSFHMPLFFFLSGFLQTSTRSAQPPGEGIRKNARFLLVPYLSFFLISLLYWLATRGIGDRAQKFADVDVGDALLGLATGLSSDLFVNPALWFLPCLFVCACFYLLLRRYLPAWAILLGAAAAVAIWTRMDAWQTRLPWGLDIVWVAMIFYAAGDAWRDARETVPLGSSRLTWIALPVVLVVLWLAAGVLGRVDMAHAYFGSSMWLYAATAFLGIAAVLMISRFVPANRPMRWLAEHSLVIFALQAPLLNLASGALKALHLRAMPGDESIWSLVFFAWVIVGCVLATRLLAGSLPWLLGRRISRS